MYQVFTRRCGPTSRHVTSRHVTSPAVICTNSLLVPLVMSFNNLLTTKSEYCNLIPPTITPITQFSLWLSASWTIAVRILAKAVFHIFAAAFIKGVGPILPPVQQVLRIAGVKGQKGQVGDATLYSVRFIRLGVAPLPGRESRLILLLIVSVHAVGISEKISRQDNALRLKSRPRHSSSG
jgi:hypothetical protein